MQLSRKANDIPRAKRFEFRCAFRSCTGKLGTDSRRRPYPGLQLTMMSKMPRSKAVPQKSQAATGREQGRAVRLTRELLDRVDAWALSQEHRPNRSEAIHLLVKTALDSLRARSGRAATESKRESSRNRAKELASDAIDRLGDAGATSEVRASRKGKLMKGPEEFRNVRRDRSDS